MAVKKTSRGFAIYDEFKDVYGDKVTVQESSLADRHCVWIFPEVTIHHVTGEAIAGAHLDVKMAKRLIAALQKFIKSR